MKVMLFFPPNWTPTMPHLALPTLAAYLRAHDVEVVLRDLNLEVFDTILSEDYMRQAVTRLRQLYGSRADRRPQHRPLPKREIVQWALANGLRLAKQVEQAKEVIRSPQFFDGPVGLRAFRTVIQSLEVASLPFYPASLNLQTYVSATPVDSSRSLLQAVRDPKHNIFLDIYRRIVLPDIERQQPDIVGISIPSMPQMLAGMTLGHLVKESRVPCHVTVGGPHISMLRDQLPKVPRVFELFDSAVVFDGEEPLLALTEAVSRGMDDLSHIPNLVWMQDDTVRVNERKNPEKIQDLPMPDFDGMPLGRYLAPNQALPLLTARGCYFGKCAFCNVGYGEPESFSQLRAERLSEQMLTLQDKYGVDQIFFSDEAVSPRNLKHLSALLADQGTPIHWGGCVRFERVISQELLEQMYQGGCRMVLFGLESASQAIIDHMVKGTQLEHMSRILRQSHEAGIWNHTFFFFGFPGETIENAQETVNFLFEHKEYINSAALGTFLMERYSPAHRFPDLYSVKRIIEEADKDLAIYFDYEVTSGMDAEMAERVMSRFMDTLPDKQFPHFYVSDVYRFLYASHLSKVGQTPPPWLIPEEETVAA